MYRILPVPFNKNESYSLSQDLLCGIVHVQALHRSRIRKLHRAHKFCLLQLHRIRLLTKFMIHTTMSLSQIFVLIKRFAVNIDN